MSGPCSTRGFYELFLSVLRKTISQTLSKRTSEVNFTEHMQHKSTIKNIPDDFSCRLFSISLVDNYGK